MIPDTTQGRHTWPWQGGGEWQDKKVGYFAVENLATIWSLQTFLGHLFICINKKRHCVKNGQKIGLSTEPSKWHGRGVLAPVTAENTPEHHLLARSHRAPLALKLGREDG